LPSNHEVSKSHATSARALLQLPPAIHTLEASATLITMRNTCLILISCTILTVVLFAVNTYFIKPTPREIHNFLKSYLITMAICGTACALIEPRLVRDVYERNLRNYAIYSKSMEGRLESAQVTLRQSSPSQGSWGREIAFSSQSQLSPATVHCQHPELAYRIQYISARQQPQILCRLTQRFSITINEWIKQSINHH
jgi:hypothetical protein